MKREIMRCTESGKKARDKKKKIKKSNKIIIDKPKKYRKQKGILKIHILHRIFNFTYHFTCN